MKSKACVAAAVLALTSLVTGCGGGGGGGGVSTPPVSPPPPPPPAPVSAAGMWFGEVVTPNAPDITTGFEFADSDGFEIGNAPFTADFQGGIAESPGAGDLTVDGTSSWRIDDAGASIVFATPGESLSFSARTVSAGDIASIQVFDENGVEILNSAVPDAFTLVSIVRDASAGEALIGSVQVTVTAGGEIVIDGLSFSYVETASTDDLACLLVPDGEFACIFGNGLADIAFAGVRGSYAVSGNQVTGSGNLYAVPGEVLPDRSMVAPATISAGTVQQGSFLNLTLNSISLSFALTSSYNAVFDRGSGLATVQGTYSSFDLFGDASSLTISSTGIISGQTTTGCVLSGQVSVFDSAINAYDVNLIADAATCGSLAGDYSGLGTTSDDGGVNSEFSMVVFVEGQAMIFAVADR